MKKQIPWNGGYFNVYTPDKVAETIKFQCPVRKSKKF